MPELKPTCGIAFFNEGGLTIHAGNFAVVGGNAGCVPCLIMPAWRPIEDAPKDGRKLILWADGEQAIGFWATKNGRNGWWRMYLGWATPTMFLEQPPNPEESNG